MATFNLTDNAWIPVILHNGNFAKLSLTELFEQAHLIKEIFCDSTLETISLNRFLQALLIRIYQVNLKENWFNLWRAGKFDIKPAIEYFKKWYYRFDIFDKERPFYQSTITLSKDITAFSKLRHEEASANNATLFDHSYDDKDFIVPIWRIPTKLITAHSFSVGGGISKPFNFAGAPLISGCVFWIKEENLFKSLMLNTDFENIRLKPESYCSWEKPHSVQCINRVPEDYLDYLTWQSRSIKFDFDSPDCFDNQGNVIFGNDKAKMYFHQGDKLDSEFVDPLMAKREGKDKTLTIRFDTEKAIWRNANILFEHEKESGARTSKNISFVAANIWELDYDINHKFEIEVYGLINDRAKVVIIKKECLPFLPSLMEPDRAIFITNFLNIADKQANILYSALSTLGKHILYPSKDEKATLSKDERNDINGFVKSLSVQKNYWADLEAVFIAYLPRFATIVLQTTEEFESFRQEIAYAIFNVAKTAFNQSTRNFNTNPNHFRAITLANQKLYPITYKGENNG